MTRESGKRTRLRFGSVSAEVSLVKATVKPKAAEHETRRVLVEQSSGDVVGVKPAHGPRAAFGTTDPFGDPVAAPERDDSHDAGGTSSPPVDPVRLDEDHFERRQADAIGDMLSDETFDAPDPAEPWDGTNPPAREADRPEQPEPDELGGVPPSQSDDDPEPGDFTTEEREGINPAAPTYVPPATRVEQGVHLESGEWVDLTAQLAEVDERTKVDGLEVVRTIPASSYASEHVRELHYLAGVNPGEYKVLSLLWRALRTAGMAAEVRWTKRTAQARGIILARGALGHNAHLALLELEWAENLRKPSARATGPITARVSVEEARAALELVESFAAPAPRAELRDERLAKRAELLSMARSGKLAEYVPPAEPMPEDLAAEAGLAEALELAAAWNREHAPA